MPTVERSKIAAIVAENLKRIVAITYDGTVGHVTFFSLEAGREMPIDLSTDHRTEMFSVHCNEDTLHAFVLFAEALTGKTFTKHHRPGEPTWRFACTEPSVADRRDERDTEKIIAPERPGRYRGR